jgi:RNA polymerase sigma-70 factor (ECF subfamily)
MNGLPIADILPVALPEPSADRLSRLFDAHYERLYRLARRLVPTSDAAGDLVQDTFLRAARAVASIPIGSTGEEAWLVRVLINLRRDEWRKTAVRRRHQEDAKHSTSVRTDQEAAFVARATVWRALDRLTPRRRAVLVMHELEGLTIPAIASLLGISAITVRWHVSKGRGDLARVLRSDGGEGHGKR